jgi:homoserine dehydrogenase
MAGSLRVGAGPLRLGIAGLGTVGSAVLRLLEQNGALIAQRAGRELQVVAVSARNRQRDRGVAIERYRWYDDPLALAADPEVDLVVELIGGADGPALALCRAALAAAKPVVTANKALLAHHGAELARLAEARAATIGFEAAVAGGVPIVKTFREGLAGNRIRRVYGILNGTCNYILTTMRESGRDFDDVLQEAQALGYAEADPSFDIDGVDAAHKLALLSALAFGCEPAIQAVYTEGIRHVSSLDITFASEMGYRIKLLGVARLTEHGLEQRVHPSMVRIGAPISQVEGVFNAVVAEGDQVGSTLYSGRGAGGGPTASAVVADLADLAKGACPLVFGVPSAQLEVLPIAPMDRHYGAYYFRLMVVDKPGVMADVAACLRDHEVSIEALIQRARNPGEPVPIVLTTHETAEAQMTGALAEIGALEAVLEPPRMIRIEAL